MLGLLGRFCSLRLNESNHQGKVISNIKIRFYLELSFVSKNVKNNLFERIFLFLKWVILDVKKR
jgi:hypothetical protein